MLAIFILILNKIVMKFIENLDFLFTIPVFIVIITIVVIIYILRELGITVDVVKYNMKKFESGDSGGIKIIIEEMEIFLDKHYVLIYITNILIWIGIVNLVIFR